MSDRSTSHAPLFRDDHTFIFETIPDGSRVLDLGCGFGELLGALVEEKGVSGRGVEISADGVAACVSRGLSVYHGDINEGLSEWADGSFDYVILNQTLHEIQRPLFVLTEMLRVGDIGIVGFPNYGYLLVRLYLLFSGRMPATTDIPYAWDDTPNIHPFTLRDFDTLLDRMDLSVIRRKHFPETGGVSSFIRDVMPNSLARNCVYLIGRKKTVGR
ncbi:MAG: methionine biosynthesis protein MetW [Deltaproteobacteria bacterium]|nr:methionine biosynthesis protein MetW [Candidatus Zymogenaceae bacterium]